MGDQYAQPSGTVMQILLISVVLGSANTTSAGIVYGMEKHKRLAFWAIGEAVANLVLSIILVQKIGIYGVAWGTAIPSIFIELLSGPAMFPGWWKFRSGLTCGRRGCGPDWRLSLLR